jgi:murein DD-endopeptidase MepM/ murein hydrolase activator NlpD
MKQRSVFLLLTGLLAALLAAASVAAAQPTNTSPEKSAASKTAPKTSAGKPAPKTPKSAPPHAAPAPAVDSLTLTKEERAQHAALAKAEDTAKAAVEKVRVAEAGLKSLEAELKPIIDQHEKLSQENVKTIKELTTILDGLWPVYVRRLVASGRGLPSWDKADREFIWLSETYKATREKLDKAQQQQRELEKGLARKQEAVAKLKKQLVSVNKDKDALLARRLTLMRSLSEARKQKKDEETEVKQIIGVVQDLNYKLPHTLDAHKEEAFGRAKGALPWPLKGRVVQRFNPNAAVPGRGLGLACEPGAKARAVHRGKVVHDDVLRGFGRVIILMHDDAYYTLYAFLQNSAVSSGQEVEKGQVLGDAGYYPKANGDGLYFELRFRQKPINPEAWLAAQP